MSNRVTIQRREVKRVSTGDTWKEIHIFDDYGDIDSVMVDFLPDSDIVLFSMLVQNYESDNIYNILHYLITNKAGVTIDGNYYDYEQIEQILIDYWRDNNG